MPAATPPEPDRYARLREEMVEYQLRRRGIDDERVLQAMAALPRHEFVPRNMRRDAYADSALPIGCGQTISQPYMVALMLSQLQLEPHHRALEVGAGSGYAAALMGMLCGTVYAIELVEELAERAARTLQRLGIQNVHIVAADGSVGHAPGAPYDRILVSAAAPELPAPLGGQLAEGGRLVAPVGGRSVQTCQICTLRDGRLHTEDGTECVFVPLLGEYGWRDEP